MTNIQKYYLFLWPWYILKFREACGESVGKYKVVACMVGATRSIWHFRHFIFSSINGELKRRFARSSLGGLWFVLHPLLQATIFALVLSEVLASRLPGVDSKAGYAIYLMAGMAAWGLFSEIAGRSTTIFIEYASVLKKISFPRICLPIIVGGSSLLNHILLLFATAIVFLFFGHYPGVNWLLLPAGMVLIVMFAFGLGMTLGVLNVFARDIGQVFTVILQIWFWLTPVVYTASTLPKSLAWLIAANPMAPLVKVYQDILLFNRSPDWGSLLIPFLISIGLMLLSLVVFRRAGADMVDEL